MTLPFRVGDVLKVELPEHTPQGIEQEGYRPAVVIAVPEVTGPLRFPALVIVPLTSDKGYPWAANNRTLYPLLPAKVGGLKVPSVALIDQLRAIGIGRVRSRLGTLPHGQLGTIQDGLQRMLQS